MKKFIFIFLSLLVAGCGNPPSADSTTALPTTHMHIGSGDFVLEMAISEGEQAKGLMRRDSMAADHGMIFISDEEKPQTYWNHDVRFPLDNLFLDHNGKIISIQHMDAYDDANTKTVQAQYVIELNAGIPQQVGVKVGDTLSLPADVIGH
jgi:uncharacterized protein